MKRPLFDLRMADGSRHFADLPESYDPHTPEWERLRDHVVTLEGSSLRNFVTDHVTEAWIDFDYAGQRFSLNNQHGRWWLFVDDPACPDDTLEVVRAHCARLLGE